MIGGRHKERPRPQRVEILTIFAVSSSLPLQGTPRLVQTQKTCSHYPNPTPINTFSSGTYFSLDLPRTQKAQVIFLLSQWVQSLLGKWASQQIISQTNAVCKDRNVNRVGGQKCSQEWLLSVSIGEGFLEEVLPDQESVLGVTWAARCFELLLLLHSVLLLSLVWLPIPPVVHVWVFNTHLRVINP